MESKEHLLALPEGTQIQQYQIEQVLGYGGFGIVYKARHIHLDEPVAIKEYLPQEIATRDNATVLPLSAASGGDYKEGLARFMDEAKQLVKFSSHPNIVLCRDYFETNGTAYLVMQFEDGMSLSELLQRREQSGSALSEAQVLNIILPLLDGLAEIHRQNVLHRDIKPGNIFIRYEDEQPVLIDFGAAKQDFSQHSKSMAPYTMGYAALEQVEAEGNLGPWTDIYAIGAVMWRMLFGELPLAVTSRVSGVARGQGDPLGTALEKGSGDYSDILLAAVDKAMQLDESNRYQAVSEMVADLKKSLHSGSKTRSYEMPAIQDVPESKPATPAPSQSPAPSNAEASQHTDSKSSRLPLIISLSAAAVLILAIGVWFSLKGGGNYIEEANRLFAEEQYTAAVEQYKKAANQGDVIAMHALGRIYGSGLGVKQNYREAAEWYKKSVKRNYPNSMSNLASLYWSGADGFPQNRAEALKLYEEAAQLKFPHAYIGLANHYRHGVDPVNPNRSVQYLHNCLTLQEEDIFDLSGKGDCYRTLGDYYRDGFAVEKSETDSDASYRRAREYYTRSLDAELPSATYNNKEMIMYTLGEMAQFGQGMEQNYREAAYWYEKSHAAHYPDAAARLGYLTEFGHGVSEDKQKALTLFKAAEKGGSNLGRYHLGRYYFNNKQYQLALPLLEKYIELGGYGWGYYFLGDIYQYERTGVRNLPLAREHYLNCAKSDVASCYYRVALMYQKGEGGGIDKAKAFENMKKAADLDNASAIADLAYYHWTAFGTAKDVNEAARLWKIAANKGIASAQYNMAVMAKNGWGGERKSEYNAFSWYKRSADNAYTNGQFETAERYASGLGVSKNLGSAYSYYKKAAEAGHEEAQHKLGHLYQNGQGVTKNTSQAIHWFQQAARQGNKPSQEHLKDMGRSW
jgi:TPR repeat protein/serine/threonine protein kinase